jgi:hypothetical protein
MRGQAKLATKRFFSEKELYHSLVKKSWSDERLQGKGQKERRYHHQALSKETAAFRTAREQPNGRLLTANKIAPHGMKPRRARHRRAVSTSHSRF